MPIHRGVSLRKHKTCKRTEPTTNLMFQKRNICCHVHLVVAVQCAQPLLCGAGRVQRAAILAYFWTFSLIRKGFGFSVGKVYIF